MSMKLTVKREITSLMNMAISGMTLLLVKRLSQT